MYEANQFIEADRSYVDPYGNLRLYNLNEKHSVAHFAVGTWKSCINIDVIKNRST